MASKSLLSVLLTHGTHVRSRCRPRRTANNVMMMMMVMSSPATDLVYVEIFFSLSLFFRWNFEDSLPLYFESSLYTVLLHCQHFCIAVAVIENCIFYICTFNWNYRNWEKINKTEPIYTTHITFVPVLTCQRTCTCMTGKWRFQNLYSPIMVDNSVKYIQ